MEMAILFREGHCSLSGKIMSTIFHSIKLLHLAQLATHIKVKERDLFSYDREEWPGMKTSLNSTDNVQTQLIPEDNDKQYLKF